MLRLGQGAIQTQEEEVSTYYIIYAANKVGKTYIALFKIGEVLTRSYIVDPTLQ